MPRIALAVLLALAACSGSEGGDAATGNTPDPSGWQLASGQPPTQAEFAALAASCQDRAKASIDVCLSDLGLKRAR